MTSQDDMKKTLSGQSKQETAKAHNAAVDDFLAKPPANVVGLAEGVKWKYGKPTGEPALIVLVTQKLDKGQLRPGDLAPDKLADMQTDVLAIGYPYAGGNAEQVGGNAQMLAKRARPAPGGYSVGHKKTTAGTIATSVYDILPGGTTSPPLHGIGIPSKYYILSNNHVLANSNNASPGDAILQPGPYDGGTDSADRIATLTKFIPIAFAPDTPLDTQNNIVDAAIAEGSFNDLDRMVYWNGHVRGWRPKANITVGMVVKKTGRTTNFTTGRITAVNATVDVNYGSGRIARFKDQMITTGMSSPGDSGSLVLTLDNVAIGLLFAGSSSAMMANYIENVRSLLRVEVAEQIIP